MDLTQAHIFAPLIAVLIVKITYVVRNLSDKKFSYRELVNSGTDMSFLIAIITSYTLASFFSVEQIAPWVINGLVLLWLSWKHEPKRALSNWWSVLAGVIAALLASASSLENEWDWLNGRPSESESQLYLYLGLGIFIAAQGVIFRLRNKQWRKLPTAKRLVRAINFAWTLPGALITLFAFVQLETRNQIFDDRIYVFASLLLIIAANYWAWMTIYRKSKKHLAEEREHFLELKEKDKKKKKKSRKKTKKSRK